MGAQRHNATQAQPHHQIGARYQLQVAATLNAMKEPTVSTRVQVVPGDGLDALGRGEICGPWQESEQLFGCPAHRLVTVRPTVQMILQYGTYVAYFSSLRLQL